MFVRQAIKTNKHQDVLCPIAAFAFVGREQVQKVERTFYLPKLRRPFLLNDLGI